jgi:hypothetical protein
MQQLDSLSDEQRGKEGDAGQVAASAMQACYKTTGDRIAPCNKHDGDADGR